MGLLQRSLAVVGADHPNKRGPGRRFEIQICKPGEPVELRPEPKNPKDPQAVAVYSARDVQIGYLRAEQAPWIGSIIREGREVAAVFQHRTDYGCVIRAAFDGDVPTIEGVPIEPPAPTVEDDFYPDFIPPDE
jgi:hypothetical protein